jgi:hypothetical protein
MTDEEFRQYVDRYLGDREPTSRYASFDYCFNYFQGHRADVFTLGQPGELQSACKELGLYLASWGMYRGKSRLLQRSVKALEPVIEAVVGAPEEIWQLDVDGFDAAGIAVAMRVRDQLRDAFRPAIGGTPTHTLLSKTMLGVFGCVPAFDRFVRSGLGVSRFDTAALQRTRDFFDEHAELIEQHRRPTLDVVTGEPTERRYPQAKVVDMVHFVKGGGGPASVS